MLKEETLSSFSVDALYALMALKLEEFEQMGEKPRDIEQHIIKGRS